MTRHSIDPQDTDGGVATGTNNPCPDPDAHWRLDEALERAEKAEEERNDARHEVLALRDDLARAEAINHEVTARSVVNFLADSLRNLSDADRDYLSRILAKSGC